MEKKIPVEIIRELECKIDNISHGLVKLVIHIRGDNMQRYVISHEKSILSSDLGGKNE